MTSEKKGKGRDYVSLGFTDILDNFMGKPRDTAV